MMTREESEVVKMVYSRFMQNEDYSWTEMDDELEMLSWLKDDELIQEAEIKYFDHSKGLFRCRHDHPMTSCMAPLILESVEAILALHDETGELHPKNRYVLQYYIVFTEMKLIFIDKTNEASSA